MSLNAASSPTDLPAHTWRGWWLAWPKWFRIGCWALFGSVILHAALAVRIGIGRQEPADVRQLRESANLYYFWEPEDGLISPWHEVLAGLYGRSHSNVSAIHFYRTYPEAGDAEAADVARRFPHIRQLSISCSALTRTGLESLRACRELRMLDVSDTDMDDTAIAPLLEFPHLEKLDLRGTRITDAALPLLNQLSQRIDVNVSSTEMSEDAMESLMGARLPRDFRQYWRRSFNIVASIRWADGEVCERLPIGDTAVNFFCLEEGEDVCEIDDMSLWGGRSALCFSINQKLVPERFMPPMMHGLISTRTRPHKIVVAVNEYASEPVEIDGDPSLRRRIEFHMPVTRHQVLCETAARMLLDSAGE